ARLRAREVVEQRGIARMVAQPFGEELEGLDEAALVEQRRSGEGRLPRRDLVRTAGLAADGEHERSLLLGNSHALELRVADEDDRAGGRGDRLTVDRERGAAPHDEVELLVSARTAPALLVLLDDVPRDPFPRVSVDS